MRRGVRGIDIMNGNLSAFSRQPSAFMLIRANSSVARIRSHSVHVVGGAHTTDWLRGYLWFHIGCGWLLTTLLVVGLTGLVRK